jgi:hypothetical protein
LISFYDGIRVTTFPSPAILVLDQLPPLVFPNVEVLHPASGFDVSTDDRDGFARRQLVCEVLFD